jgi:hypothetical protein
VAGFRGFDGVHRQRADGVGELFVGSAGGVGRGRHGETFERGGNRLRRVLEKATRRLFDTTGNYRFSMTIVQ